MPEIGILGKLASTECKFVSSFQKDCHAVDVVRVESSLQVSFGPSFKHLNVIEPELLDHQVKVSIDLQSKLMNSIYVDTIDPSKIVSECFYSFSLLSCGWCSLFDS